MSLDLDERRERARINQKRYRDKKSGDPEWRERKRANERAARAGNKPRAAANERRKVAKWRAEKPWIITLRAARRRARTQGLAFDLTLEWAEAQAAAGSALSGVSFAGEYGPRSPSIDRIDPGKGYTMDNCRLLLLAENLFKNVWSDADVIEIARAMVAKADGG